jgi:two-component system sensor histidine kinase MprB
MSLRARLALSFAVVAIVGVGVASAASFVSTQQRLDTQIDHFLDQRADEIIEGSRAAPRTGEGGNRPAISIDPDAVVQILDPRGDATSSTGIALPVDDDDRRIAAQGGRPILRTVTIDGVAYRMETKALRREGQGAVQVARSLTETRSVIADLRSRLAIVGVAVAVAAAAAGWLVARRTTEPLRELAATAGKVAETGDLSTRVATDQRDEVGQLSRSFDTMLDALATSREQQHRLVHDAGHELRTPLTALRTDIDLLRRAPVEGAERAEVLANLEAEAVELSELVGELIALATDSYDDEPVVEADLADVVADAVERFRRRSGRTVTIDSHPSPVIGRPQRLERAVANLLGNAHKFSPPDRPIEVWVRDGTVAVRDHGPGIAPADRPRVFDRFYRGELARTAPGSGLGLAIVDQVARLHGGSVAVGEPADGGEGAVVSFSVPVRA